MESKKKFASLMEDDSTQFNQPPPFTGRSMSPTPSGRFSLRRGSRSPRSSPMGDSDQGMTESCVARETSKDDCSTQRFIVWVAVKRNSCQRMTDNERLECPLLRCTRRFPNHESMLKHVVECSYLSTCEYWCFDHSKVERFDDSKCKRCLGHPSRRRKMLYIAKNFFSSLGHKSKKSPGFEFQADDPLPPPPSYDEVNPQIRVELSATEIVEIDSTELVSPPPLAPAPSIDPQALLLPELDSTAIPAADAFFPWQPSPLLSEASIATPDDSRSPGARPSLQVNTQGLGQFRNAPRPRPVRPIDPPVPRSKNLSPSSSVRSTASTMSNISSVISPISTWSHGSNTWSSGLETNLTSPTGDFPGPCDSMPDYTLPEEPSLYSYAPEFPHELFSELPADMPPSKVTPSINLSSDPLLFPFDATLATNMTYDTNVVLSEDIGDSLDLTSMGIDDGAMACCSETTAIVMSTWDLLQAHIASSLRKMQDLGGSNPLAEQLRLLPTESIASTGFQALRVAMDGYSPASPVDTLCFVHLVYALSLVNYGEETVARSRKLFLQSLAYAEHFAPGEREQYAALAVALWQPADLSAAELAAHQMQYPSDSLQRSSSQKGKGPRCRLDKNGDAIVGAARDFLDELEISVILGRSSSFPEVFTSDLFTKHMQPEGETSPHSPFAVTVKFILQRLLQGFSDASGLGNRLSGIYQSLASGSASSVRKIEIELLRAGSATMSATTYLDKFVPQVRYLCDQLYAEHEGAASQRSVFYGLGIALMEAIIFEVRTESGVDLMGMDDPSLDEFLADIANDFGDDTAPLLPKQRGGDDMAVDDTSLLDMLSKPAETNAAAASSLPTPPEGQEGQKSEANDCCDICGYRPKGDPQWFKGSMAKHKKLQHSNQPPKIYKCPYPGCNSQYKNRQDNLRQHQIEKNHWVGDEAISKKARRQQQQQDANEDQSSGETTRRPSKRKKISE